MVLLVQRVALARGHDQLVDALPELGVAVAGLKSARTPLLRISQVGRRPAVANTPTAEMPTHMPIRVGGCGDDRVQAQAAVARLPLGRRRVVAQALDVLPGAAAVAAAEQARRLDARVERRRGPAVTFQTVLTFGPSSP